MHQAAAASRRSPVARAKAGSIPGGLPFALPGVDTIRSLSLVVEQDLLRGERQVDPMLQQASLDRRQHLIP